MTHNEEHLAHCESRIREAIETWRAEHPGQPFTVDQVVADLTEDDRCVFVLINSIEGAEIYQRNTFEEWRFDYAAFSRREWSAALKAALMGTNP